MSELVRNRSRAELRAQLEVVVDLAVVGDPVVAAVAHRLVARLEVDDRQPAVREADVLVRMRPDRLAVRPAMADQLVHRVQRRLQLRNRSAREGDSATDSAHSGGRIDAAADSTPARPAEVAYRGRSQGTTPCDFRFGGGQAWSGTGYERPPPAL